MSRSRTGELLWEDPINLTDDNREESHVEIAFDSDGHIHGIWSDRLGNITYGKMTTEGDFLNGPLLLGTSELGPDSRPRIDVDPTDEVHVSWFNNTGPNGERVFEYVNLDADGSVVHRKSGAGGDDLIALDTGFAALRHYNDSQSGLLYGDMELFYYDDQAALQNSVVVGHQEFGWDHADMVRDGSGNIYIVYLVNTSTMNLTKVKGQTVIIDQQNILSQQIGLSYPAMEFDDDGDLHIVWIDDEDIEHQELDTDGSALTPVQQMNGKLNDDYVAEELMISRSWTPQRDFVIMAGGYYKGGGGGGGERGLRIHYVHFTKDGTIYNYTGGVGGFDVYYCGHIPAIGNGGDGRIFLLYGWHRCADGSQYDLYPKGNLMFRRSSGYMNVDLSVSEEDIHYPDRISPGGEFTIQSTVWHRGTLPEVNYTYEIRSKENGTILLEDTRMLGAGLNRTYSLNMTISEPTGITFHVRANGEPDLNMSNNTVNITLTPFPRPDMAIYEGNITLSDDSPVTDQEIDITARVNNLGGAPAELDVVLYYDGLETDRRHILCEGYSHQTILSLSVGSPGLHRLAVALQNITPAEEPGHDLNNHVNTTVVVVSSTEPTIEIIRPVNGTEMDVATVNITGTATDPDQDPLDIYVRIDDADWRTAEAWPLDEGSNGTGTEWKWYCLWNISDLSAGSHTVFASVVDDVHDNQTTAVFTIIQRTELEIVDWSPPVDVTINETDQAAFEVEVWKNNTSCTPTYLWYLDGETVQTGPGAGNNDTFFFMAGYGDAGIHLLEVEVTCGDLPPTSHEWNLTILDLNRPPRIISVSPDEDISVHVEENVTFSVGATDPDGDDLTFHWTSSDGRVTNIDEGNLDLNWTAAGNYTVTVKVTDGRGGEVQHTWNVSVEEGEMLPDPSVPTSLEDGLWLIALVIIVVILVVVLVFIYYKDRGPEKG